MSFGTWSRHGSDLIPLAEWQGAQRGVGESEAMETFPSAIQARRFTLKNKACSPEAEYYTIITSERPTWLRLCQVVTVCVNLFASHLRLKSHGCNFGAVQNHGHNCLHKAIGCHWEFVMIWRELKHVEIEKTETVWKPLESGSLGGSSWALPWRSSEKVQLCVTICTPFCFAVFALISSCSLFLFSCLVLPWGWLRDTCGLRDSLQESTGIIEWERGTAPFRTMPGIMLQTWQKWQGLP